MSGLASSWTYVSNWFRRDPEKRSRRKEQQEAAHATDAAAAPEQAESQQLAPARPASRDKAIAQLQGAYDEMRGLMYSLQDHMQAQSDRSERLLQMMEGLPEALKTLPELNRNQTRMLEAIHTNLEQQTRNTETLTNAIQGLAHAADNHEHSMQIIQKQLDASQQSGEQLVQSFSSLSQTLNRMSASNDAGTKVLQNLADRTQHTDAQMREMFNRNHRQTTVMAVVSWALAIAALSVAGAVAYWVTQSTFGAQANATSPPAMVAPAETAGPGGGQSPQAGMGILPLEEESAAAQEAEPLEEAEIDAAAEPEPVEQASAPDWLDEQVWSEAGETFSLRGTLQEMRRAFAAGEAEGDGE